VIEEIKNIELADGTKLEIRLNGKWFDKLEAKKAFKGIVVATKVDKTKPVLRFFFVHPSYFRAFEEFGLSLLFVPVVTNYNKYQNNITEMIQSSKETANVEFSEFVKKVAPIVMEVFIKPFFQWLKEAKKPSLKSEEEIKERFLIGAVKKMTESTGDKDIIKRFMRNYVSAEIFSSALGLGRIVFSLFSCTLIEKGLERYKLMAQEISDNDIELCNKTLNAILESNMVTPLVTVAVCMNKYCKHIEVTVSDRIPKAKCGKCNGDILSTTFTFINEPYLWLKDKTLDLHAFLQSYIESKSTQEYIEGKLRPNMQCFLNTYIRNISKKNQREVDALIYSPVSKKAIAVEIKIHQIRSQLPSERLQNILNDDLKQLVETLHQTVLNTGCYITNLKISDEEIQHIKESVIPKLTGSNDKQHIEIISATDETTFLSKLDTLTANILETLRPQQVS